MKVYGPPKELPFEHDFANYNRDVEDARIEKFKADLKAWLIKQGFTGKHTGKIYSEPVGDGYAQYMLADGKKSALIHLPFYDGYSARNVQYLPKRAVLERIAADERMAEFFKHRAGKKGEGVA